MLILVRHGQCVANLESRLVGRHDSPLTDHGRQQAAAAAHAVLAAGGAGRVVCSPLRRAVESAAALGLPVEVDERWIELDYGEYDGARHRDVPSEAWAAWRRDNDCAPPGGESLAAMGRRVRAACDALAPSATDESIVVVSHVSPIKAAVAWALGAGDEAAWRMHLDTASISTIALGRGGPVMRSFNETQHLLQLEA
jgi:broad specificity phosphatase PhoE